LLDNPSDSQDKKAEIVNVGTARTNAVNCGNKTDAVCASIKRGSCSRIANTCGSCISGTVGNLFNLDDFNNSSLATGNRSA
jgi:hypothetical protein